VTSLRKVQKIVQLRVACPKKGKSRYPISKVLNSCKKCRYHKGVYQQKDPDDGIVLYVECDFLKEKMRKV
jgi:hypothetical protein